MGLAIGRFNVRRAVQIRASARRVWEEFQDSERLGAWFSMGHQLDVFAPGLGGRVELSVKRSDVAMRFGGDIIVWDEAAEMSFENDWLNDKVWLVPTYITFRLTDCYGGVHVELFHHGFEAVGADADKQFLGYESNWDLRHLTALKSVVEGG